jgi:CheY-like chemotaxis protein
MGLTGIVLRNTTDPKQKDQLGKVGQASQNLLSIINDILDIAKIEAERLTLEHIDFKLGEVLENLNSLLRPRAAEKGVELRIDVSSAIIGLMLQGDPLRLGQVLLNLTGNAVKFTEAGSVTVRILPLEESATEVVLRFEVQDTGIGIPVEAQQRLFSTFEQADNSMTRKYGGTGLGLVISRRLANLMGGSIGVESVVGSGSTFWFTARLTRIGSMPSARIAQHDVSVEDQLKTRYAGRRLLLAEDEPINQEVSRSLLEEVGFKVDLAQNGEEAVDMAQLTDYALILMDVQMPVMNGTEATALIRAIPGREHTPILAMTANAFEEDRRQCLEAGMNDHIGKPVDPDALYETLLRWLPEPVDEAVKPDFPDTLALPQDDDIALRTALNSIIGIDFERGLKIVRGNLAKFVHLLNTFARGHADDIAQLRACLEAGEMTGAQRLAHTLKGLAATLGAEDLRQSALAVEQAVREQRTRPDILDGITRLEILLLPLVAAIQQLPSDRPPFSRELVGRDGAKAQELLQQLEILLAHDDTRAHTVWRDAAPFLEAVLGPLAVQLRSEIEGFDFHRALQTVRKARSAPGYGQQA